MKENKLISMVDFVIEQRTAIDSNGRFLTSVDRFRNCENYAQFLQQPLTLGMFVPCVNDVPINKPNIKDVFGMTSIYESKKMSRIHTEKMDEYQQAKERVLFEGFSPHHLSVVKSFILNGYNIEEVVKWSPTLTKSALKQIGV